MKYAHGLLFYAVLFSVSTCCALESQTFSITVTAYVAPQCHIRVKNASHAQTNLSMNVEKRCNFSGDKMGVSQAEYQEIQNKSTQGYEHIRVALKEVYPHEPFFLVVQAP